jgi:hypothetical protein
MTSPDNTAALAGALPANLVKPAPKPQGPKAGATVIVGCKIPSGLIIDARASDGEVIRMRLNGSAVPVLATLDRKMPSHQIEGGFGLTTVNKDAFMAWWKDHQDYEPVKRGFVFVAERSDSARSIAQERRGEKTGFEPLNPDKLPTAKVTKMTKED